MKKMIVKGPVLIPEIADTSGDVLDEKTIRKALLIIAKKGILIDVQHSLRNIGKLLELYITDSPVTFLNNTLPKGTMFASIEVIDEDIQQAIREGKYKGFSILGAPIKSIQEMDRGLN